MRNSDHASLAVKLIDVALSDFEASKTLFERKLYPQAVFMLQQSLEKAIKAALLKLNLIHPDELERKIGHYIMENAYEIAMYRFVHSYISDFGSNVFNLVAQIPSIPSGLVSVGIPLTLIQMMTLNVVSYVHRFATELTSWYKSQGRKLKVALLRSLNSLDGETRKRIEEVKNYLCNLNELFQQALSSQDAVQSKKYLESIVNSVAQVAQLVQPDARKAILEMYNRSVEGAVLGGAPLIHLHVAVFWYIFFEPYVSRIRYPRENWSPLDINEDTAIVYLCREALRCIEKNATLKCLREFVANGKLSSQECLDVMTLIKEFFEIRS